MSFPPFTLIGEQSWSTRHNKGSLSLRTWLLTAMASRRMLQASLEERAESITWPSFVAEGDLFFTLDRQIYQIYTSDQLSWPRRDTSAEHHGFLPNINTFILKMLPEWLRQCRHLSGSIPDRNHHHGSPGNPVALCCWLAWCICSNPKARLVTCLVYLYSSLPRQSQPPTGCS